jgi:hypothetical protein
MVLLRTIVFFLLTTVSFAVDWDELDTAIFQANPNKSYKWDTTQQDGLAKVPLGESECGQSLLRKEDLPTIVRQAVFSVEVHGYSPSFAYSFSAGIQELGFGKTQQVGAGHYCPTVDPFFWFNKDEETMIWKNGNYWFIGNIQGSDHWFQTSADGASREVEGVQGLRGTYWNNKDMSGEPHFERIDYGIMDMEFGSGGAYDAASGKTTGANLFSAIWTGSITLPETGSYTFGGLYDDGIRIYIGKYLVLEQWKNQLTTHWSQPFQFSEGTYNIRIEWYENHGVAHCELQWTTPNDSSKRFVPSTALSPFSTPAILSMSSEIMFFTSDHDLGLRLGSLPTDDVAVQVTYKGNDIGDPLIFGRLNWQTNQHIKLTNQGEGDIVLSVVALPDGSPSADEYQGLSSTVVVKEGNGQGLRAFYYNTPNINADRASWAEMSWAGIEPQVFYNWGHEAPHPRFGQFLNGKSGIPADSFSARYEGSLLPDVTGEYTLVLGADDGYRIWLGDDADAFISDWTAHAYKEQSRNVHLTAGEFYPITIEFYERGGHARIEFKWKVPGDDTVVAIPTSNLVSYAGPGLSLSPLQAIWADVDTRAPVFDVRLTTQPSAPVTVYLFAEGVGADKVKLTACSFTFTADNWSDPQQVTLVTKSGFESSSVNTNFKLKITSDSTDSVYHELSKSAEISRTSASAAMCTSWGDPHYVTFDQKKFNFYGDGDYYLIREETATFAVQTRQGGCSKNGRVTCNFGVAVMYQDAVILAYIDANSGSFSYERPSDSGEDSDEDSSLKMYQLSNKLWSIKTSDGIEVKLRVDWWGGGKTHYINVYTTLPPKYRDTVTGLCGTFDDNPNNDYSGTEDGESHAVPVGQSLFDYPDRPIALVAPAPIIVGINKPVTCVAPGEDQPEEEDEDEEEEGTEVTTFDPPGSGNLPETGQDDDDDEEDFVCDINQEQAESVCQELVLDSQLATKCIELDDTLSVDFKGAYDGCVIDVTEACDAGMAEGAASIVLEECQNMLEQIQNDQESDATDDTDDTSGHTNPDVSQDDDDELSIDDLLACDNDCSGHGVCTKQGCVCEGDWTGELCDESSLPPDVTSIVPDQIPIDGKESVIIKGSGFSTTHNTYCKYGDSADLKFEATVLTPWQLTCRVPPGDNCPGNGDCIGIVSVCDTRGCSDTSVNFEYIRCPMDNVRRRHYSLVVDGSKAWRCYIGTCYATSDDGAEWNLIGDGVDTLLGINDDGVLFGLAADSSFVASVDDGATWVPGKELYTSSCQDLNEALTKTSPEPPSLRVEAPEENTVQTDNCTWWISSEHVFAQCNGIISAKKWICACA